MSKLKTLLDQFLTSYFDDLEDRFEIYLFGFSSCFHLIYLLKRNLGLEEGKCVCKVTLLDTDQLQNIQLYGMTLLFLIARPYHRAEAFLGHSRRVSSSCQFCQSTKACLFIFWVISRNHTLSVIVCTQSMGMLLFFDM